MPSGFVLAPAIYCLAIFLVGFIQELALTIDRGSFIVCYFICSEFESLKQGVLVANCRDRLSTAWRYLR